jgi:hypothetical protein
VDPLIGPRGRQAQIEHRDIHGLPPAWRQPAHQPVPVSGLDDHVNAPAGQRGDQARPPQLVVIDHYDTHDTLAP